MKDILEATCNPELLKRAKHDAHVLVTLFLHLQSKSVQGVAVQTPRVAYVLWSELLHWCNAVGLGCCLMHKTSSTA